MSKRLSLGTLAFFCFMAGAGREAFAQNFLMNSAETINRGNFKISLFPTVLFGEDDADDNWGVGSRFGYGFTDSFDVEGKVALFDGVTIYGVDAELWLVKGEVDFSMQLGGHLATGSEITDSKALDIAALVSGNVARKLELYGGLAVSFESLDDVPDSGFTRAYFVPGLEYKLSDDVDLLAEFGVGLNDDSPNYFSFGLALYIR
jgi:hypothetical protein